MKTEAVRILESLAIPHTIRRFRATARDLICAAAAVAADLSENT